MREQKVTSANYGNTTTDGCCSGRLQRWTFWRPMVHRMIVAGAAFPPSIQSSRVSWIKVRRTTPVEVGGKPDNWSEKPLWAIWWAKAWRAAALSGTIRVLSKTAARRLRPRTCKGQGLDMEHPISVLKTGQFDGHRWSCHLVVSLCVQCNHEDVQKLVKSKNKQSTETKSKPVK